MLKKEYRVAGDILKGTVVESYNGKHIFMLDNLSVKNFNIENLDTLKKEIKNVKNFLNKLDKGKEVEEFYFKTVYRSDTVYFAREIKKNKYLVTWKSFSTDYQQTYIKEDIERLLNEGIWIKTDKDGNKV